MAGNRDASGQVDRCGGLAHASFLIRNCNDVFIGLPFRRPYHSRKGRAILCRISRVYALLGDARAWASNPGIVHSEF